MQVLGGVLFCLGALTVLLAKIIGFELDIFYVVISILGAVLFLFGVIQRKQKILTTDPRHYCAFCTKPDATDSVQTHR